MIKNNSKYQRFIPKTTPENIWKSIPILIIGLILTFTIATYTKYDAELRAKQEFGLICNEIKTKIATRLYFHAQILRNGSAFFAATDRIARKEWKAFYDYSQLNRNLPGIQGLGFSLLIPKKQLQQHTEQIRREGFPNYTVRPDGDREIYTSIIYIEPFANRNLRAFGYDMYSEPIRRKAMELARDKDVATLSGKVILVQETDKDLQAGTLMYVPVYQKGLPTNTVEERRIAIIGWVYSPYRMVDLMEGILGRWDLNDNSKIRLHVFDNDSISLESLLYDSQKNSTIFHPDSALSLIIPIEFNDKKWTLYFSQSKESFSFFQSKVFIVILSGFVISFLLFSLSLSLFNTRFRAEQMAEELTSELRGSEERIKKISLERQTILDNIANAVFFLKKRVVIWANKNATGVFGYALEEMIGEDTSKFYLDQESFERLGNKAYQILSQGMQYSFEEKLITKTKEIIWGALTGQAINPNDLNEGTIWIIEDITERKRMEEQVIQLAFEKQTILDNIGNGIFFLKNRKVVWANKRAAAIYGFALEEIIGDSTFKFHLDQESYDSFGEEAYSTIALGMRYWTEIKQKKKTGEIFWCSFVGQAINPRDQMEGSIWVTEDITKRKQMEEKIQLQNQELAAVNASKDKFFSIIAHDLRGPFNAYIGLTEMMQNPNISLAEVKELNTMMNKSASSLASLLENLLTWARMQRGTIEFKPMNFELSIIVIQTVTVLSETAKQKNIELINKIPAHLNVYADLSMLDTVLRNLISNAIKFTHRGGKVTISAEKKEKEILVSVQDSGIGMNEKLMEGIFRIDVKTSRPGTEKESSTGLGLLLCKEFIEKHNGKIWVESKVDKGSTFYFTLYESEVT